MKTIRIILYLGLVVGFFGLFLTLSFRAPNACEFANSNIVLIKEQTKKALEENNINRLRYHAFRALNEIESTKRNFKKCGCDEGLKSLDITYINLKQATETTVVNDSKNHLDIALQSTLKSMESLQKLGNGFYSATKAKSSNKDSIPKNDVLPVSPDFSEAKMTASLLEFEESLQKVVQFVDCKNANTFILKIQTESKKSLTEQELSATKRRYHTRVAEITQNALLKLKDCTSESKTP